MKTLFQTMLLCIGVGGLGACVSSAPPHNSTVVAWTETDRPAEWALDSASRLVLSVRTGPDSGGPIDVAGVVRLSNGSFIAGSGGTSQLLRFDAHGRYQGAFGRAGMGPGEFDHLWDLWAWGDTVVAFDARGVGQVFGPDGAYFWTVPGISPGRAGVLTDGSLVEYIVGSLREAPASGGTVDMSIQLRDTRGGEAQVVGTSPAAEVRKSSNGPTVLRYGPQGHVAALPNGYCTGYSDDYVVRCYDRTGALLSEMQRTGWTRRPVSAKDQAVFFRGIDAANPGPRAKAYREYVHKTTVFADVFPPYGRLVGSEAEELWVGPVNPAELTLGERNPVSPDSARWSVYSTAGRWLADIVLPARFRLLTVGRDHVAGLTRDDEGNEQVVVYRIVSKQPDFAQSGENLLRRHRVGERGTNEELAQREGGDDGPLAQAGEVVLVRPADLLDEAVDPEPLQEAAELGRGVAGQERPELAVLKAADVEFAVAEGEEEGEVVGVEKVEAAVGPVLVGRGPGEAVQRPGSGADVLEGGNEVEIAAVGCLEQPPQGREAVDGLLDGGDLGGGRAVAVFHRAVVLEEGDVVGRGFDPEDQPELVVHLQAGPAHVMFDPGAVNPGVEVRADLALVERVQGPAEEGAHVLSFDRVDGGTYEGLVEGGERRPAAEDNVGGVLDLLEAPVVAAGEAVEHGAALARPGIEAAVEALHREGVGELLGAGKVGNVEEDIVRQRVGNVVPPEFAGQPRVAIAVELEPVGSPRGNPQMAEAQEGINEVEVVVEALAAVVAEIGAPGRLVVPGFERRTGFHRGEDRDQPRAGPTLGEHLFDPGLFAALWRYGHTRSSRPRGRPRPLPSPGSRRAAAWQTQGSRRSGSGAGRGSGSRRGDARSPPGSR